MNLAKNMRPAVVSALVACLLSGVIVSPQSLSSLGLEKDDPLVNSTVGLRPLIDIDKNEMDTVYVTEEGFKDGGIFFAFRAFWIATQPVNVSIWRPTLANEDSSPKQSLTFIGNVLITPEHGPQTIYIVSSLVQKCVRTQKGDRIGFEVKKGGTLPFSINYDESMEASNILASNGSFDDSNKNSNLDFIKLKFPYKMNFIAYLEVDGVPAGSDPEVECPRSLSVESVTTTTPAMIQGDTGPSGDTGPAGDEGDFGPIGEKGPTGLIGPPGYTGSQGSKGLPGSDGPRGDTGSTGLQGPIGDTGPIGSTGDRGMPGDTGSPGPDGMNGMLIFSNGTENSSYDFSALLDDLSQPPSVWSSDDRWKSERIMIGLLVWFSLLSLLCLVFLVVVGCLCSRLKSASARRTSGIYSHSGWNTFGSTPESQMTKSPRPSVSVESAAEGKGPAAAEGGTDTLRVYGSDDNVRALREDTFKEFDYQTIPDA